MARIFTTGFETNTTASGIEWNGISGGTITGTTFRSGGHSYRISGLSSGASERARAQYSSSVSDGPWYFRVYINFATFPSIEDRFLAISDSATVATGVKIYVTADSTGNFRLYDEDGQIGSASTALDANTWYRLEIEYDFTPSAGSDIVRARLDGVEFAGANDRSISSGANHFYIGGNLNNEAQTTGDWFFDDVAVNNTTGSFENSYPGNGSVLYLLPNAAGDQNDWTNDYTAVDEFPPDDATTFVASNTLNQISEYNLADAGLTTKSSIKVVMVGMRFNGAAASANATITPRIKASSGGTVEEGTATTPTSTSWRTNDPANAILNPRLTTYNLPGPSNSVWLATDLDNMQIGVRISTANTNNAQLSTIWAMVEYETPLATENIAIAESVVMLTELNINKSESISAGDVLVDIIRGDTRDLSKSDSMTVTESISVSVEVGVIVTPGVQQIIGVRIV